MSQKQKKSTFRYVNAYITPTTINYLHLRNPWITAWWAAAFPGFGHLMLCKYLMAFILMAWELIMNYLSGINQAIYYSMIGQFDAARQVLDTRWLLFYIGPYIFGIWDGYRRTVDLNKTYTNGYYSGNLTLSVNISSLELNYLEKRKPYLAIIWSLIAPGLGHLYLNRLWSVCFIGFYSLLAFSLSNLLTALHFAMEGHLAESTMILNPQWLLHIPSMYVFSAYDAYVNAVEYNRLFEKEQARYLKNEFQHQDFCLLEGIKCIP